MFIDAIEVREVGVDFDHPVHLGQSHGANVDSTAWAVQEWLVLDPRNDIMQAPRPDKQDRGGRKIPPKSRGAEKDEERIRHRDDQLRRVWPRKHREHTSLSLSEVQAGTNATYLEKNEFM
jgi:hypothetical protein